TYAISLILISGILILSVDIITGPIKRVRKAIHNITVNKDFSHKVRIEYPDEIGALVFDFNDMTSSLDLAYRKLKKYALDEAVAKKEMFIREKETLIVLGKASDYKDPETGAHIARVSNYSLLISKALGQDNNIQDLIYYAAPLHDIGKLGIPDSVLLKPGKLTDDEFELIKTHTTIGSAILENPSSKYLKAGAVIAKTHHEKIDGSGYPYGLKGEEIPILGRIVSVADVFDSLTTERPYKKAWSIEKTQEYMMSKKGIHFDPELVDLFFKNLPEIIKIQNLK
ncbi:MAG: HD domain-containing protein, partial [Spirochaetaceae bacterium]|nr:HD domain-containing protein [Spirochaetaceae bacterium]